MNTSFRAKAALLPPQPRNPCIYGRSGATYYFVCSKYFEFKNLHSIFLSSTLIHRMMKQIHFAYFSYWFTPAAQACFSDN
jgi:hypothetical protein